MTTKVIKKGKDWVRIIETVLDKETIKTQKANLLKRKAKLSEKMDTLQVQIGEIDAELKQKYMKGVKVKVKVED